MDFPKHCTAPSNCFATWQIHHLQNYNKILRYKGNGSKPLCMRAKYFSWVYLQHCPCSFHRNNTLYRASWCLSVTIKNCTMKLSQKSQKSERIHRGRLPITILPNFLSPTLALTTKTKFLLKIRHPLFFYWLIPKGYYFAITNISPWAPANIELNIDRQSSASELGNRSVITELRKSCVLRNQTAKHNRKHALLVDI